MGLRPTGASAPAPSGAAVLRADLIMTAHIAAMAAAIAALLLGTMGLVSVLDDGPSLQSPVIDGTVEERRATLDLSELFAPPARPRLAAPDAVRAPAPSAAPARQRTLDRAEPATEAEPASEPGDPSEPAPEPDAIPQQQDERTVVDRVLDELVSTTDDLLTSTGTLLGG